MVDERWVRGNIGCTWNSSWLTNSYKIGNLSVSFYNVCKQKKMLSPNSGGLRYADIAYSVENAATPDEYISSKRDMITFMASV